jgi:hypothetical protein
MSSDVQTDDSSNPLRVHIVARVMQRFAGRCQRGQSDRIQIGAAETTEFQIVKTRVQYYVISVVPALCIIALSSASENGNFKCSTLPHEDTLQIITKMTNDKL